MIIGIHQPHYFPWLGYLDKMAKSDKFVILDEVQLSDRSPMVRNKFLQQDGKEIYLSLSIHKCGHREKQTKEIELANLAEVQDKHKKFFQYNYKKTPFFDEIMENINFIFEKKYTYLLEITMDTIEVFRKMFGIKTDMFYQSNLIYERGARRGELMLELTKALGGDIYLSGNGARKYMDNTTFEEQNVSVAYQQFEYPVYPQYKQKTFIPNLSSADILFQCGIEKSREFFWNNVEQGKEFTCT